MLSANLLKNLQSCFYWAIILLAATCILVYVFSKEFLCVLIASLLWIPFFIIMRILSRKFGNNHFVGIAFILLAVLLVNAWFFIANAMNIPIPENY
jgi:hypothetical protein